MSTGTSPPAPDEIHVWYTRLDCTPPDPGALSPDERARAARFLRDRARRRFVAARSTLRRLLSRYLGVAPDAIAFAYGERGKPFLLVPATARSLRFNLSHSHEMAIYAFARDRDVGIDVEHVRDDIARDDLARRFFSPHDAAWLRDRPPDAKLAGFFRIWTLKEAFIKATGEGVARPLREFDVLSDTGAVRLTIPATPAEAVRWSLHELEIAPGYAAALVVEGMPSSISSHRWPP